MNKEFFNLLTGINSLTVYENLKKESIIVTLAELLNVMSFSAGNNESFLLIVSIYSRLCSLIFKHPSRTLSGYIKELILYDKNLISTNNFDNEILQIAQKEFELLKKISNFECSIVLDFICANFKELADNTDFLPIYKTDNVLQRTKFESIINSYQKNGYGIFAKYKDFLFNKSCNFSPIEIPDDISFDELKLYQTQKKTIYENTFALMKGKSCQNILLYGDRGCGKSSTVKAVVNLFNSDGLRIVQIKKDNLVNLDLLIEKLSKIPLKFIIFIDDLTFNENDDDFNILKATLEGALAKQPDNIAIYATTNRCHLVKETFSSREGNEVHLSDTLDEILSLSDRFGIVIYYERPQKNDYLEIVKMLANDNRISIPEDELFKGAEAWAIDKAGRSPRVAQQYIKYLCRN